MLVLIRFFILFLCIQAAVAEDELEWELDFEIRQKSTLSDFPLQEIGQDELSNAAIAGALQKTSSLQQAGEGKPAHQQEEESSNKAKVELVEKDQLEETQDAEALLQSFSNLPPPVDFSARNLPDTYRDGLTNTGKITPLKGSDLFYSHGLGQVPRLINISAFNQSNVVTKQL